MKPEIKIDTSFYKVLNIRNLTENSFVIELPECRFSFKAGQHVSVTISGDYQSREYSIYSPEKNPTLEILVKEVEGGHISPKLKNLKRGDLVQVHGPFGKFCLDEKKYSTHLHVFIASGTGIAPFHSIVKSNPDLNYLLAHGIKYGYEAYEKDSYDPEKYILCTSRDNTGKFNGRVTEFLRNASFEKNTVFYLCGNSDMIFDAMEIIKQKGFNREDVNVEVYF